MTTGTLKNFITPDGGGHNVFVHISAFKRAGIEEIDYNARLSFDVETAPDGRFRAVNLQVA